MFGKRTQANSRVTVQIRGSALGGGDFVPPGTGVEFRLTTDLQTDPVSGWQCMINPGTPQLLLFAPHGGGTQIDLRMLPPGKWSALSDTNSGRLPLEARADRRGAYGRWIVVPIGEQSDPHEHDRMSDADRSQLTQDAFAALTNSHYKTMSWIGGLR
jgi:hypothetical protein